jgi:hypothetical protein
MVLVSKEQYFFFPFQNSQDKILPRRRLSTILGAAITYQSDHLPAVRAFEDDFDICAIGVREAESKRVEVILWMFRNSKTCAFIFQGLGEFGTW